jgi:hypothetical protein
VVTLVCVIGVFHLWVRCGADKAHARLAEMQSLRHEAAARGWLAGVYCIIDELRSFRSFKH